MHPYTSAPYEPPAAAWYVVFGHGDVYYGVPGFTAKYVDFNVRAVRGGL